MSKPPCIMKWDARLDGYVPVLDATEASDIAKRCFYRSADHLSLTLEERASALLGELAACDTSKERRAVIVDALIAESATPVHPHLYKNFEETVVGRDWLEDWINRATVQAKKLLRCL